MKAALRVCPLVLPLLVLFLLLTGQAMAATPDEDLKPIKTGVTITGLVEEEYADGLLVTTDNGVSYLVLTPDAVSLEQEEAFHKQNKGKQVSLTGDVYKDEDGTLSLYVKELPR